MAPQPDQGQIANLAYRYVELVDSGDFHGLGEMFVDGVLYSSGEPPRGVAEVRSNFVDWLRVYPDNGTPHTRHLTTNLIIGGVRVAASTRPVTTVHAQAHMLEIETGPRLLLHRHSGNPL
ncbi:nuclear transport factor 2 family protein [Tomitella cavernea]|uniref:SnoaL-like domain-containing protein n=1 Tax=Tomitella cavernea TaxID=1387982 RepID=A0ABP9CY34_9ACTN|nr:nuclear transport factor 2 family protein [Tomitella cavernea]